MASLCNGGDLTVWSTTQSSLYEQERRNNRASENNELRAEKPAADKDPPKPARRSSLDGDALLILALIMILSREKCDNKLIFALLITLIT